MFCTNKIDVMDEESVIKLCVNSFSLEEISAAKELLFKSFSTTVRNVSRRKNKTHKDLEDILCVFKNTDPDITPIFVAKELQKLPPVTFDHIDVTRLLKDIVVLKSELKDLKELDLQKLRTDVDTISSDYVSVKQLEELQSDIVKMQRASNIDNFHRNINENRGACLLDSFEYDSGPMGLHPLHSLDKVPVHKNPHKNPHSKNSPLKIQTRNGSVEGSIVTKSPPPPSQPVAKSAAADATLCDVAVTHLPAPTAVGHSADPFAMKQCDTKCKLFSEIMREGEWKLHDQNGKWEVQQRKKSRNRFLGKRGKAVVDPNVNFKAADIKVPIYIYNVSKGTTVCDIVNYVNKKINLIIAPEKMTMKVEKDYDAYKIFVPKQKLELFMEDDFWPDGIAYRRFIDFGRNKRDRGKSLNAETDIPAR